MRVAMWLAWFSAVAGCQCSPSGSPSDQSGSRHGRLIVVESAQPWLVALVAPVTAVWADEGTPAALVAGALPPSPVVQTLVDRYRAAEIFVIASGPKAELRTSTKPRRIESLCVGDDPYAAGLKLMRAFWPSTEELVMADADAPGDMIRAAALAARHRVPLLPLRRELIRPSLRDDIAVFGVERLIYVASRGANLEKLARVTGMQVIAISPEEAEKQFAMATESPRTVVVGREPDGEIGLSSWYAPYVSLARRAPLVLCTSGEADAVEKQVRTFLDGQSLCPATITLLADYKSIGTRQVELGAAPKKGKRQKDDPPYKFEVEPFVPVTFDRAVPYGVGRIPFDSLEDVSVLFVRGLKRDRQPEADNDRVLLVANPGPERWSLPLCETISRATATELRNGGCQVDDFYRTRSDDPRVMAASRRAGVIVYEGHNDHQELFPLEDDAPADTPAESNQSENGSAGAESADERNGNGNGNGGDEAADEEDDAVDLSGPLDGLPVAILQACQSLKPEVVQQVYRQGGVALVAGTTPIHSGSGSVFTKALLDSALGDGRSLGEALCDAQNFLFCVQQLRRLRGHEQMAKVQRVALSFRLWGDPEVRVFRRAAAPELARISAKRDDDGAIEISLPKERLSESTTDDYVASFLPGSQAAGIVQHINGRKRRNIMPVYFFRLTWPDASDASPRAEPTNGDRNRAVFRLDPRRNLLYVLYFPQQEEPGGTIRLPVAVP